MAKRELPSVLPKFAPQSQLQMEFTQEIFDRLNQLEDKYASLGQDMVSYLDGLLYSSSLTYWDYVHLDTLLSLQNPKTPFKDETIFITYHQITELYFKLIRHEINQLVDDYPKDADQWKKRVRRVLNYFKNLTNSFDVMVEGMDRDQFLKFRMALLPASGFQSAQYRMIEIMSTPLVNLVEENQREKLPKEASLKELYELNYWKFGNLELKTGQKTLTLRMFEDRYDEELIELAEDFKAKNINNLYLELPQEVQDSLKEDMRNLDLYANVFWPLSHYKSAVRYLNRKPDVIAATGGTNWQKYLPPRFQRVSFFPTLWTEQDKAEWGKGWVLNIFREKVETNWGKVQ